MPNMTSAEVRAKLVEALGTDLVGPEVENVDLLAEVLEKPPSVWYLTGFLVPSGTPHFDASSDDTTDEQGNGGVDDNESPESAAAKKVPFPSSIGISFLVPKEATVITVTARWGEYWPEGVTNLTVPPEPTAEQTLQKWVRKERTKTVTLALPKSLPNPEEKPLPESGGLCLALTVKPVKDVPQFRETMPAQTRSVCVFLVNRKTTVKTPEYRDAAWVFQAGLTVACEVPFVRRPNVRDLESKDWDDRVADLQYHDVCELAVGHGVSTRAIENERCDCHEVQTRWVLTAEVERVAPAKLAGVTLMMDALAAADAATLQTQLSGLVTQYRQWIEAQKPKVPPQATRKEMAGILLHNAGKAAERIEIGLRLFDDAVVLKAFQTANRVMAVAARQRGNPTPEWRPFQLAFILLNLEGIVTPNCHDRAVVDLLFFPTGGGKTEAYLGLAAFTLVYRRLTNPGIRGAGLSVLMRYTLRLLTLDQLGRAATLICALELERQQNVDTLGDWPFEIGLWVGRGATPNELGHKGHKFPEHTARHKVMKYQDNPDRAASPIPLEECPWCGTKFAASSFVLWPNADQPSDLRIVCQNRVKGRECPFQRNNPLPIIAVDEPIYRRLPCFLIATVDKFAAMPWTGPVGGFFGKVQRHDRHGFYGPCDPNEGMPIPGGDLPPPDLVIQDELHLISGPMGTMVGLYETALDELCSRTVGDAKIRPKIVASTATVRRASTQIRALFCRDAVDIFPPPGPDRRDSFFAVTHDTTRSNARLYLGLAAQGRSPKVILLRSYLALLGAAKKWYAAEGGDANTANPADPYMTLLGYFGSLRELGGSRRIVEDEVQSQAAFRSTRKRVGEKEGLFANRHISYEPVELTSRVRTDKVAEAKRRLEKRFHEKERVDVAMATNMISVGLDITRLGLMVVLGQPKAAAEYIQATSRVGRDEQRPGLVITVFNIHRPRDRSHFERFGFFHQTFYRSVEATSVTPFSPRALDRGLAGTLVALARQGQPNLTAPKGAAEILKDRSKLEWVAQALASRAAESMQDERLRQSVLDLARRRLDDWEKLAKHYDDGNTVLQYNPSESGAAQPLLRTFLDPDLPTLPPRHMLFRANRSMRDVEPSISLRVRTLDDFEIEEEDE